MLGARDIFRDDIRFRAVLLLPCRDPRILGSGQEQWADGRSDQQCTVEASRQEGGALCCYPRQKEKRTFHSIPFHFMSKYTAVPTGPAE